MPGGAHTPGGYAARANSWIATLSLAFVILLSVSASLYYRNRSCVAPINGGGAGYCPRVLQAYSTSLNDISSLFIAVFLDIVKDYHTTHTLKSIGLPGGAF